jgi:hypothetical protein
MSHHLNVFVLVPALVTLITLTVLLAEFRLLRSSGSRSEVEQRATALLRSWLTPDQQRMGRTSRVRGHRL